VFCGALLRIFVLVFLWLVCSWFSVASFTSLGSPCVVAWCYSTLLALLFNSTMFSSSPSSNLSFLPSSHVYLVRFELLLDFLTIMFVSKWCFPPHLLCINLEVKGLELFNQVAFFVVSSTNYKCFSKFCVYYVWTFIGHVCPWIYFGETIVYVSSSIFVQILFVIKIGSILTLINRFVVCKFCYHSYTLFCITFHFAYSFLHEESKVKRIILTL
jgi:hypothetical protein